MKLSFKYLIIFFIFSFKVHAADVTIWLESEIENILNIYKNTTISNIERFESIEKSINNNFAGAGIAKFVAGKAWPAADQETKKNYIKLFKRHLSLNIAAILQGYSNQTYSLINTIHDETNKVIVIEMEIQDHASKILISWRVKESKGKFYIIDLIVADISLVVTKRSEFNSMLKKVDYDLKNFNETLKKQNDISYNRLIK